MEIKKLDVVRYEALRDRLAKKEKLNMEERLSLADFELDRFRKHGSDIGPLLRALRMMLQFIAEGIKDENPVSELESKAEKPETDRKT